MPVRLLADAPLNDFDCWPVSALLRAVEPELRRLPRTVDARLSMRLDHPNLVQMFHAGEIDGSLSLAMEYLAGRALSDVLATLGKIPAELAAYVARELARGLAHTHALSAEHGAPLRLV